MKTRLSKSHRHELIRLAKKKVEASLERRERDEAYARVIKYLEDNELEAKWPKADMAILSKHGVAVSGINLGIHFVRSNGRAVPTDVHIRLPEERKTPADYSCRYIAVDADGPTAAVLLDFEHKDKALKKLQEETIGAYSLVINSARFYEDLVEAWPEAAELGQVITGSSRLPAIPCDDALRIIQVDMARRKAA